MATTKYFADIDGQSIELHRPYGMDNAEFTVRWPSIKGKKYDGYKRLVATPVDFVPTFDRTVGRWTQDSRPVTRAITYKSAPSKHVCDARCMYAKGKTMQCECSCGGKNHGAGGFTCG